MAGRPETKLNDKQLKEMDQMAKDNCKDKTIAKVLGIDVATLKKHYSTRLKQKRAMGQADLRRTQQKQALTNPVMAIFLGKNNLQQTDKQEITGRGGAPLLAPQLIVRPEKKDAVSG